MHQTGIKCAGKPRSRKRLACGIVSNIILINKFVLKPKISKLQHRKEIYFNAQSDLEFNL